MNFVLPMLAMAATATQAQSVVVKPATPSLAEMRRSFQDPPAPARLRCYWWWLNGNTDKPTITHDLEEMRAKGFGGALLVDANGANQVGNENVTPGPTFASPEWIDLYTHALREADRLGLEITLNITSGWNLGGPDVRPEDASKVLTWSRTTVTGGALVRETLANPPSKNGLYKQIAVLAYPLHAAAEPAKDRTLQFRSAAAETGFSMPDASGMLVARPGDKADAAASEVIDLSSKVSADGSLQWQAPDGKWEVLRVGYTSSDARVSTASGAWQGLAIDYLSPAAFDKYWDHTVEPLLAVAKPYRSLRYLASDSWELGGTNWTEEFAAEFRKRRGYDPVPWLPVVAGRTLGSADESARFLADLRRTVADLVSAHYDRFAERAAQHGMGTQAESGGPHGAPIDALETFRHAAVVQTEFWSENAHRSRDNERFFNKEAASAANIYGQRFVAAEGETSIGPQWSESLATDLKPSFDMAVTEGMNRLVWHEFTSSPADTGLPGQEYFAGTHLSPKITWWNAGGAFFTYLNRVQYLMQQGTPVNDVLYFYGDNVPAFVRLKADDPAHVLPGYDYDVANQDALLRTIHVVNSELVGPSGVRWRALVLPRNGRISLQALRQLQNDLQAGATVIGMPPGSSTGMASEQGRGEFAAIVREVWGERCDGSTSRTYGKGHLYCTENARAALAAMQLLPDAIPQQASSKTDVSYTSDFDYLHRLIADRDVYFVRNGSSQAVSRAVLLRAHGNAEQWDPVTGESSALETAPIADGRTRVTLTLPAFGSAAIVLSPALPRFTANDTKTEEVPLTASWTVRFQPGRGATMEPIAVDDLTSWTGWSQPGVRNFSGTATYTAAVHAPAHTKGAHVFLAFADVREIALVKINGHDAGTVWAKPLELRVDPWLKPGRNTIEVQVTNLWANRVIGDRKAPSNAQVTRTNIRTLAPDTPLLPSGLIGPVRWVVR